MDKMKFDNMEQISYADKKRVWVGRRGKFRKNDMAKWYKLYDETKLYEVHKRTKKEVVLGEGFENEINNEIERVVDQL